MRHVTCRSIAEIVAHSPAVLHGIRVERSVWAEKQNDPTTWSAKDRESSPLQAM